MKTKVTAEEILLKYVNLESSVPQGKKDWLNSDVDFVYDAMTEYSSLQNAELKERIAEFEDMSNKLTQIVASQKETFDVLLKKYNALEQQADELDKALRFAGAKLYILLNTTNGLRKDIVIDAQKASDRIDAAIDSYKQSKI